MLKSKIAYIFVILGVVCGGLFLNGCGASSSGYKVTITGSGN